ncbi:MAG: hypothetical protein WD646_05510 [Actinomycetota bacterium]
MAPPLALVLAVIFIASLVAITGNDPDVVTSTQGGNAPEIGGATPATGTDGRGADPGGVAPTGQEAIAGGTQVTAPGVARSGVVCKPGVRQVPWSRYSPLCTARFTGDNGRATAPGVTKDTITLSYRRANTAQQQAIAAIAGDATPSDDPYIRDLNTFAALFNSQFETYGRRVVIKPYQGQGDFLQEDLGQGQERAQADAVRARELGAFADITFPSATSLFYSQALHDEKIISWGFPFGPQSWYEGNSPYQYNWFLDGTKWSKWAANVVCRRMKGLTANFAGDPALRSKKRVFGLISVEFPTWLQSADQIQSRLSSQCGVKIARRASYPEDIGAFQQNASNMAAQMRDAGVTTVICFCDPLMPIFITKAATEQEFRPEWFFQNQFDPITQNNDQSQMRHAISTGPAVLPEVQSEAYKVHQIVRPGAKPAQIYYQASYLALLHVFSAIQAAGPDLNPRTFQSGMFSLPDSIPGGDWGDWRFGPGSFTPTATVGIVYWNADKRSINGKFGTWTACREGSYPLDDPSAWGPANTQVRCF